MTNNKMTENNARDKFRLRDGEMDWRLRKKVNRKIKLKALTR